MVWKPAVALALVAALAGCGAAGNEQAEFSASPPPFTVLQEPEDATTAGYITAAVDTDDDLRGVFDAIRAQYGDEDRGFLVRITCAAGDNSTTLANGSYANGSMGAAQIGLDPGAAEFASVAGAACPPVKTTSADEDAKIEAVYERAAEADVAAFASGERSVNRAMGSRVAAKLVDLCETDSSVPAAVCAKAQAEHTGE